MKNVVDDVAIKWSEDGMDETPDVSTRFTEIEQHADTKVLDELSALGDQLELTAWHVGWLTDKLYRNLIANKMDVDYLFVCYYVAVKKLKNQRSLNTIKKYALTARFFPQKVAKKYNYDILPMSHFAYAATFADMQDEETGTPIWQMVLDYSWSQYVNSPVNRHVSVRELKAKFTKNENADMGNVKPYRTPTTGDFMPSTAIAIDNVSMSDIPVQKEAPAEMVTNILGGIIQNFTMAISNYIPTLQKKNPEIGQALAAVIHNLELIASKLEE